VPVSDTHISMSSVSHFPMSCDLAKNQSRSTCKIDSQYSTSAELSQGNETKKTKVLEGER
jgi:hypothetical protein